MTVRRQASRWPPGSSQLTCTNFINTLADCYHCHPPSCTRLTVPPGPSSARKGGHSLCWHTGIWWTLRRRRRGRSTGRGPRSRCLHTDAGKRLHYRCTPLHRVPWFSGCCTRHSSRLRLKERTTLMLSSASESDFLKTHSTFSPVLKAGLTSFISNKLLLNTKKQNKYWGAWTKNKTPEKTTKTNHFIWKGFKGGSEGQIET